MKKNKAVLVTVIPDLLRKKLINHFSFYVFMNNSRLNFCVLAGLALASCSLFVACDKVDMADPSTSLSVKASTNSTLPTNYVNNGINVYSSRKDFTNAFATLSTYSEYDLSQWDYNNGFTSLEEYADQIDYNVAELDDNWNEVRPHEEQTSDELMYYNRLYNMPDRVFARMLNGPACIQVGDTLYRFDNQTTYLYHPSRLNAVAAGDYSNYFSTVPANTALINTASFTSANTSDKINNSKNIKPKDNPVDGQITTAGTCEPFWNSTWLETYGQNGSLMPKTSSGRNTRLKCVLYSVNSPLFSSVGVRSRYERRTRFAGWVKERCSSISIDGLVYFEAGDGSGRVTKTATNQSYTDGSIAFKPFNYVRISRYSITGQATYKGVTTRTILQVCQ